MQVNTKTLHSYFQVACAEPENTGKAEAQVPPKKTGDTRLKIDWKT